MKSQRFAAAIAAVRGGKLLVPVPFDPDQVWGAEQRHHIAGTVTGARVRAGAPAKSSGDAELRQGPSAVTGVVAVGGGDAGDAECADGGIAQGGHDLWSGAGADLGAVLVVGDVADPVDLVFDGPVTAAPSGQLVWFRLVDVQVGGGVDRLGREPFRLVEPSPGGAEQYLVVTRRPD